MPAFEIDQVLGLALTTAFAFLALAAWRTWSRHGSTLHAHLGTASALLGAICVAFRIEDLSGSHIPALAQFAMVATLGSAAALLTVRNTLIPLSRGANITARIALVSGFVIAVAVPFPLEPEAPFTPRQLVAAGFVAATWAVCVAEPIFRFWVAARGLSVVQRARLRALSIGYGGLIALLVVAVSLIGGEEAAGGPEMEVVVLAGALLLTTVQYFAFVPPRWLRRLWREREERTLLHTAPRLLLSDDPGALGRRTVEWAVRLVGADAGFVVDAEGRIAAFEGISSAEAEAVRESLTPVDAPTVLRPDGGRPIAALPLQLEAGIGTLLVVAGPLTPPFGKDELALLGFQADTAAVALDRAKLDDMRRTFLTALSHELRTPLTSVVGIGRTLQVAGNGRLEETRRAFLVDRLVANAERLQVMLADLLDVDRLSRGIIEPRRVVTDIGALIRRVLASSDNLDGRRTMIDVPTIQVFVDGPMVERIVENLVANAAKHTPSDATIWVTARVENEDLHLTVADNGPGVAPSVRETIFEPFHRGPSAPEHAPGTGIGLSLVARFAELHGGRAWVGDRPGGGAAFHVVLPQASATPEPIQASVLEPAS